MFYRTIRKLKSQKEKLKSFAFWQKEKSFSYYNAFVAKMLFISRRLINYALRFGRHLSFHWQCFHSQLTALFQERPRNIWYQGNHKCPLQLLRGILTSLSLRVPKKETINQNKDQFSFASKVANERSWWSSYLHLL